MLHQIADTDLLGRHDKHWKSLSLYWDCMFLLGRLCRRSDRFDPDTSLAGTFCKRSTLYCFGIGPQDRECRSAAPSGFGILQPGIQNKRPGPSSAGAGLGDRHDRPLKRCRLCWGYMYLLGR